MKKSIICSAAFALVFGFVATAAMAGDVVTYDAKPGKVTFNHKAHQTKLGDCKKCHEGTPAKIAINKETAHTKLCVDCHTKMKQGPQKGKCAECHKK